MLVVEMLRQDADRGCSPQAMEKRLEEIPVKLDDLFTHLFDDPTLADREEVMQLWQWVLLVQRPLTILELHQALAFSTGSSPSELDPKKQMEDMEAELARFRLRVLNLSRGLIEVVTLKRQQDRIWENTRIDPDSRVQFIHETVKEFFNQKGFSLLDPAIGDQAFGKGQLLISKSCFNYICIDELLRAHFNKRLFRSIRRRLQDTHSSRGLPLLRYAVDYCLYHAREGDKLGFVAAHFLTNPDPRRVSMVRYWQTPLHLAVECSGTLPLRPYATLLAFLCEERLFYTAAHLVQRENFDVEQMDKWGDTPLHIVCSELDERVDKKIAELVTILLKRGADPTAENSNKHLPIDIAMHNRLENTVRVLEEKEPKRGS